MSYIVPDGAPSRPRRGLRIAAVAAVAVVALIAAAFAIGRFSEPGRGGPVPGIPGTSVLTWSAVGRQPVPNSPVHGPFQQANGLAAGFSHDELGAAIAALNLIARTNASAGPLVYETTVRQQGIGDVDAALSNIRNSRSSATVDALTPEEYFYRVTSGDPTADLVVVSIAALTPQSRAAGGYVELSRTLQWVDGDWKMHVPPPRVRVIPDVDDYTSLGKPHA